MAWKKEENAAKGKSSNWGKDKEPEDVRSKAERKAAADKLAKEYAEAKRELEEEMKRSAKRRDHK